MELSEIRQYMKLALAEAAKCEGDVPVGAVILQAGSSDAALDAATIGRGEAMPRPVTDLLGNDGRRMASPLQLVSSGFNQREALMDPLGHAELIAIRLAAQKLQSWRLSGCILVSTLEPCPMCAEAAIQSRLQTVIFGAYDPISGAAGSRFNLFQNRKSLPTPELLAGILEEECSSILKEFFAQQRQNRN